MAYGVIEYNDEGKPKCEICGKYFSRVLSHVRQVHMLNEREYKIRFGLDLKKGICSKESSLRSRMKVFENYDKVVKDNLIKKGKKSRYVKGQGTSKYVSEQTRKRLKERLKEPYMIEAMKKSGIIVGKSGLGNKKRWGERNSSDQNT
jgi:hypothetical protein